MAERKFTRGLTKPGMAAQLRETVSQVVRETAVQSKAQHIEPVDYEAHLAKNKVIFHNDPHRELLLFPADDISRGKISRECRTTSSTVPTEVLQDSGNYFAQKCLQFYTSDWYTVTYKYASYGGSYWCLPSRNERPMILPDPKHELDIELDLDDDPPMIENPPTHEGYLLKGPEGATEKMFANIATKSFKRRFCKLRQEITGSYFLDICKEEKKLESVSSICLDECVEILRNMRRNKFGFQLRLTNNRSYVFAASSEQELNQWLEKLSQAVHSSKMVNEDRKSSVEREVKESHSYGTLRGLESSLNPQLSRYARETEISIALARKEHRSHLFPLCSQLPSSDLSDNPSLNINRVEPYKEKFGHRIFIKCESINFRLQAPIDGEKGPLGQVEPYLTTVALYDIRLNKKLTEDFHFDVNQPHMKSLIRNTRRNSDENQEINSEIPQDWMSFPKQAVFSLRDVHSDIFLVVRVETVLQGSVSSSAELYVKPNADLKTGIKAQKLARSYSNRLGKYRMPFAWTARPLFRPSGELDVDSDFPAIFRQEVHKISDDDLFKILNDFRKPEKISRLASIPGSIRVAVQCFNGTIPNMLTSSLIPVKPFPLPPVGEPTVEVAEFLSRKIEDAYPYTVYVNHLYVYPKSLKYDAQKTFHRARNLACLIELRDSDTKEARPLKCIYGRPGQTRLMSQWVTSVGHHVTTPSWYDEVKINLPITLHSKHHLLFTFLHVSCDLSKQKRERDKDIVPETVVGYSWLPLMHKGRLRVEQQMLPVSAHLPPGYLSFEPLGLGKGYAGPEIRWVDGQKPLFLLNLELVSSVTARDQHLHNFFIHMAKLNETRSIASLFPITLDNEVNKPLEEAPKSPLLQDGSRELSKLVKALHAVDVTVIVNYLPVILNQLMWLIVRINNEEVSLNIIKVLIHIVHELHEVKKGNILDIYLQYVFVTPTLADSPHKATVHEEMVKTLCSLLQPSNTDFLVMHKFLRHAGFFLNLIARSMAQYVLETGRIKMQRQERFHKDHLQHVENLIQTISPHIQHKYKDLLDETRHANIATAEFIRKCLSLMDRGFAFRLISIYLNTFRPDDPRVLYEFKFQFLQCLCNHEHYVPLNFPQSANWQTLKNSKEIEAEFRLCESYCRKHYLTGLLLQEVRSALSEVADIRKVALKTLRNLMAKHEIDDRYQQKGQQIRIACLYLPWIFVVLDNWNRLNVTPMDAGMSTTSSVITSGATPSLKPGQSRSLPRNTQPIQSPLSSWQRNTLSSYSHSSTIRSEFNSNRNSSYLAIIAGQGTQAVSQATLTNGSSLGSLGGSDDSSSTSFDTTTLAGSQDNDKEKNIKEKAKNHSRNPSLVTPMVRYDKLQLEEVKDVLICFLYCMKYIDDDALVAWWNYTTQHDLICFFHILELCLRQFKYLGRRRLAIGEGISTKASTLPPRVAPPSFQSRTYSTYTPEPTSNSEGDTIHRALLESNLAIEVGLIVLDVVGTFCVHFKELLLEHDGDNPLMRKLLDIYLSFLQIGQSESLSKHVFAAIRAFINNFPVALFQGNAWLCGRLCCEVLRCCASKLNSVRQEACAVLYLLMRSNFEFSGQKALTRVHLQVIISVSQLLGEFGGLNSKRFGESLNIINGYANSDKAMQSTAFPGEVRDLTKRALTVLKATSQMRQQAQDPELLIDLQHSLANSYSATPELRKTWLETMARHHARFGNWCEAALCQIHVAALIAEYLHRRGLKSKGCEAFASISPNIVCDESNLRLDTGIHDTQYDEEMFVEQLQECNRAVEKAERYEMLLELYRLLLPSFEHNRDYLALADSYTALSQACARAAEANRRGRRLLGTYYRVALYGKERFGDDAGVEYIYKEPKVTSLAEISERLNKLYATKFGPENVKLIMDSNVIEEKDLNPHIAYIQVTHVVPYFDEDELCERLTEFEKNHNINRFMYEIPFTIDGKIRGNPEEQCKRRVILTSQYSFPYVKKRLRVTRRETQDLSPVEVALDEMSRQVKEIAEVVRNQPTDLKKLQLRLQGSISVQVNAGPLAYASAFLGQNSNYPEDQIQQLRDLYRDFIGICAAALELNGKLILSDQREYHEALRGSFRDLVASLSNILDDPTLVPEWDGSVNSSLMLKRSSVLVFSAISGNGSSNA